MRYLPQTNKARAEMLEAIGVKSVDDLFRDIRRPGDPLPGVSPRIAGVT